MSWMAITGLVALLAAGMLAWSANDVATKEAGPAWQPIDYEVLRVEKASKARTNMKGYGTEWRVHIRFVDPFSKQPVEGYGVTNPNDAEGFKPGERRKGLFAPQWPHPLLTETAPVAGLEKAFAYKAAAALALAGIAVLVVAWRLKRLLPWR